VKVLIHDFSGPSFPAQLSRELGRRGHTVVHSFCAAYVGGKGNLVSNTAAGMVVEPISSGRTIAKSDFKRRVVQEVRVGSDLVRQVRHQRPDVVMISTLPVPALTVFALFALVSRTPRVLWHQDLHGVAIDQLAGAKLPAVFKLAARLLSWTEKWCARRAAAIVVIANSFLEVHRKWGTDDRVTVIPNWAPLDEIYPVDRKNEWAVEHDLDDKCTILYSGTLGFKHNPELLVQLAREVNDQGTPARLVVVNEGPAVQVLLTAAAQLQVPLTLLPFQPYERLPEVLGSGDVLVVLLDEEAGAFSVPSKTLSYLCAGRPIVGLMPEANLAADLVRQMGGFVVPPVSDSIPAAASWVRRVLDDVERQTDLGRAARALAEREFALDASADLFEELLRSACT